MEVHVEATGTLTRRLHVKLPPEQLQAEFEVRVKRMAQSARIPGFRPGKAPLNVVRRQFGDSLRLDAVSELIRRSYPQALEQAKVQPAGTPDIEVDSETPGQPFAYTASFDVLPEVRLEHLDQMDLHKPVVEITAADVDRLLDSLRKARRDWQQIARPAQQGDRVRIDFESRIDGHSVDGGQGQGVEVELGGGQFLPDLEQSLLGRAAGEQFEVDVRFPDDYRRQDMRGKRARFAVKVHAVEQPLLPAIDSAFLQAHGVDPAGGEAALREKCRQTLAAEADKATRNRLRQQVLEQLLARHPLEVPPSQVETDVVRLREEAAVRMNLGKLKPERKAQLLPAELFESRAKQRVALGLLIGEVIKTRAIELDQARVDAALEALAADYENPDEVRAYYRAHPELMRGLAAGVLEDQVVESLQAQARISETPMSLEELLNPAASA
ncbi:MAG: trigger factor [Gammaproteobacteria bacterium]|nr:trigger factor [Gammaproteobacteria bacterium]